MRRPALVAGRSRCRHSERTRRAAPSRHRMEGRQTPQRCRQGGAYSSPHRERSRIRRRCRKPKRSTIKLDTSNLHVCRSHSEYKIGKSGRSRCFPKKQERGFRRTISIGSEHTGDRGAHGRNVLLGIEAPQLLSHSFDPTFVFRIADGVFRFEGVFFVIVEFASHDLSFIERQAGFESPYPFHIAVAAVADRVTLYL